MITSETDICNMALDYCNTRNIASLDENTKASRVCKLWYDTVRKSLLTNINASFSIKRAVLPEVADFTPVYGYNKAYSLPSDCLQVLNLDNPRADRYYQIEGNYLYTKPHNPNEKIYIRYIADVQDVTKFDADFCACLALSLAAEICSPLTEDDQKANYLKQLSTQKYIETSAKYGRDNKMIVINKPRFRRSKLFSEVQDYNYPAQ